MGHALIISDNLAVGRAIRDRLARLGFESFDLAWSCRHAVEAASRRVPDLIVAGDTIADGQPLDLAESIARERQLPVLVVTADKVALRRSLPSGAVIEGPYALTQIDSAIGSIRAAN